jgi:hypothetical protein
MACGVPLLATAESPREYVIIIIITIIIIIKLPN